MTPIHQVRLYFCIFLILVITGAGFIFNRIFAMNTAHQRLIEEWKELKIITAFINEAESLLTSFSTSTTALPNINLAQLTELNKELEEIRQASVTSEKYEESEHSLIESKNYLRIAQEFDNFIKIINSPHSVNFKPKAIESLRTMQISAIELQKFYIEEMGEAANYAQRTEHQILSRTIIITGLFLLFLTAASIWFVHIISKNTQALLEHEKHYTIGLIAQSLSHEIRNPLGIIKTSASVIKKKLPEDSEEYELSGYLIEEADRINRLIDQLLQLNSKTIVQKSFEHPATIIKQVLQLLSGVAAKQNIKCVLHDDAPDTLIFCNKDQIKQVLINIMLNAIQISAANDTITISTKATKDFYEICIVDQGPGISPKMIDKIFDPFFTTKENGSGLGLFVAKKLVENNDGSIVVKYSSNKGTNIQLIFKIPESKDHA